jgi:hypothetical protein
VAAIRVAKERAEREVAQVPGNLHGLHGGIDRGHHGHPSAGQYGSGGHGGPGSGSSGVQRVTPPSGGHGGQGGSGGGGGFSSGVRKIRHASKGNSGAAGGPLKGGNLAGAGVPLRLLSGELDDDDDQEGMYGPQGGPHSQYGGQGMQGAYGGYPMGSNGHQPGGLGKDDDWGIDASFYGAEDPTGGDSRAANPASSSSQARHQRSGSETMGSLEEETPTGRKFPGGGRDQFFDEVEKQKRNGVGEGDSEEELKRRGSVDDRTMTMSGVRLFVANPDMDDDD